MPDEAVDITIQVKTLPFSEDGSKEILKNLIYRLPEDPQEIEKVVGKLVNSTTLADGIDASEKFLDVVSSSKKCAQFAASQDKLTHRVIPALFLLPSTSKNSELSVVNSDLGIFIENPRSEYNAVAFRRVLERQISIEFLNNLQLRAA